MTNRTIEKPNESAVSLLDVGRNVRWGVVQGASFAAIASLVVSLFEIPQWHIYGPHLWVVVGTYFSAGVGAGAVVGVLRPLTRYLIGALAIGIIAAVPVAIVVSLAASSPKWGPIEWGFVRFFAFFFAAHSEDLFDGNRHGGVARAMIPNDGPNSSSIFRRRQLLLRGAPLRDPLAIFALGGSRAFTRYNISLGRTLACYLWAGQSVAPC